ncbi:MAG: hypothetical protein AAFQ74_19680, partial [Cyanobacteria bacterium J06623_4]
YLMANPGLTQRLVGHFRQPSLETASRSVRSFDPPGPDLSASEFIDLDIDNLSSLEMPTAVVVPLGDAAPSAPTALPPIESAGSAAPAPTALPPLPAGGAPAVNNLSSGGVPSSGVPSSGVPSNGAPAAAPIPGRAIAPIETQAVVMPVGLTYYVTVPFTTQQRLLDIRQSVSEAFVRRFADGNRIQIAAFDNPQAAQQFIKELEDQDITAQIYGPTTE